MFLTFLLVGVIYSYVTCSFSLVTVSYVSEMVNVFLLDAQVYVIVFSWVVT